MRISIFIVFCAMISQQQANLVTSGTVSPRIPAAVIPDFCVAPLPVKVAIGAVVIGVALVGEGKVASVESSSVKFGFRF